MIFKAKPYKTILLATGLIVKHFKDGTIDVSFKGTRDCDDFERSDCCGARRWNVKEIDYKMDICEDCREHASF